MDLLQVSSSWAPSENELLALVLRLGLSKPIAVPSICPGRCPLMSVESIRIPGLENWAVESRKVGYLMEVRPPPRFFVGTWQEISELKKCMHVAICCYMLLYSIYIYI